MSVRKDLDVFRPGCGARAERGFAAPARHGKLILGVLDPLLELPAVGVGLPRLDLRELGPCGLELLLGASGVDVVHVDGVVDECQGAVLLDLEEPWSRWRTPERPGRA